MVEDEEAARELITSVFLKYLSHPIASLRKEAYLTVAAILKVISSYARFKRPSLRPSLLTRGLG